ncbi:gametocyte-specific factor 1-like isoform X4 [Mauremys reevesii]|uniref:gametocyte-specific factor 1-like isoform X4 n=1 Tax=Mauremys reevesii TaxID=260615 RepID=UPI00193F5CD5|nr:gametocyte-specific factor 1-like isoform X4 [Mauremys reevesii]
MVPETGWRGRASLWSHSGGGGVSQWLLRSRRSRLRTDATCWSAQSLGRYFKEESDTQRLAQRVLQQNLSQRSFSISKMDLEDNYVDALDPEKLIQCPYDRYHQIRACRFPYHLIKCRKNHPDIAQQLATCPFNARHQVPRAEIRHHISSCDDKSCIEQDIVSQSNNCHREMNTVSMWQPSPCDEDWDKELQEQSDSVFVWGTFNSGINNSPASSVVMEPKNNLMPGMRAPRSLPYSLSWKSSKCKGAGN